MRRTVGVDRNQSDLVDVFRGLGARVILVNQSFDLLVLWKGQVVMVDIKNKAGRNRLTVSQQALLADGWPLHFVTSVEEAVHLLGAGTIQ